MLIKEEGLFGRASPGSGSFTQRSQSREDSFSSFTGFQDISGREINGFLLQYKIKLEPFWEKPPKWGHNVF